MKIKKTSYRLKVLGVLAIVFILLLTHFMKIGKNYSFDDAVEYIMVTEAWTNHGSLNIKSTDVNSYFNYLRNKNLRRYKEGYYENYYQQIKRFENKKASNKEQLARIGLFAAI